MRGRDRSASRAVSRATVPPVVPGVGPPVRSDEEAVRVESGKRRVALVGAGIAGAVVVSACSGGQGGDDGGSPDAGGGTYSIAIVNPENPLVPGNTSESEGSQVIRSLWTGLVQYAPDGAVEYTGVAEEITSEDNTTWTITLKDG